jgi:hypothetical protein
MPRPRKISIDDLIFLRNNSQEYTADQLAERIGCSVDLVKHTCFKCGLKMAPAPRKPRQKAQHAQPAPQPPKRDPAQLSTQEKIFQKYEV